MIHLLFIAPYPELRKKVEEVLACHPEKSKLNAVVRSVVAEALPSALTDNYDAIIARGYTAQKLNTVYQHVPVIQMPISGYDVLQALATCCERFHPRQIAVFGSEATISGANDICHLLQVKAKIYAPVKYDELEKTIQQSIADGCDALVGGYSACLLAQSAGLRTVTICTSEGSVQQCIDTAIRTVDQLRQKQVTSKIYKAIIDTSEDGIIYVDTNGLIQVQNQIACQMSGNATLLDLPLKQAFPPILDKMVQQVTSTGQEETGRIFTLPGSKITVSARCAPVVLSNGEISGAVINLADITHIQNLESQIRRQLNERGLQAKYHFSDIIHESSLITSTIERAKCYAGSDSNVIIVGETGTGKELFAQSIHNSSKRKNGPFVVINCAALSENLLESELFGYVDGAFTGASKGGKMGLFEQAHGGTLFLDEMEDISTTIQSKLLRVLQEHQVRRIGDNKVHDVDVRIISATNKSITQLVEQGKFRRDLMYRLDVLRLFVPPLRVRGNDIELLFMWLLEQESTQNHVPTPHLMPDAIPLLREYPFAGNIRELKNVVERVSVLSTCDTISREALQDALYPQDLGGNQQTFLQETPCAAISEQDQLLQALEQCGGNRTKAARLLGIDRSTLWRKLQKYHIP